MTSYNDAYSRRGDEDRYYRPRDYDRRRDSRDDHDRDRDRDRSRGRNPDSVSIQPRDPPRDPRAHMPPTAPRSELAKTGSPLAEHSPVAGSKRSPSTNAKLEDVLRNWMETAQKKAQTEQKMELKRLAQLQRKMEYSKSIGKSADYPSVAEFQKKQRDRHEKDLADLEKLYKTQVAEFEKVSMELAACVVKALPVEIESLVQRRIQEQLSKQSGLNEGSIMAVEESLKAKIVALDESLNAKTAEMTASVVRDRLVSETKLAAEIEKKLSDRFDQKLAAQQKLIDRLVVGSTRLVDQLAEVQNEKATASATSHTELDVLKEHVGHLESRLCTDQQAQQGHTSSLYADISKLRLENTRLREDIENLRESAARSTELATVKAECREVRAENIKLSALLNQTRDDNRDLNTRFGEYAEMAARHDTAIHELETASQQHRAGISRLDVLTGQQGAEITRLDRMAGEHQDELSRLDLTMLEQVAEGWGIEWPNVLSSVQALQGVMCRVEKLEAAYRTPITSTGDHLSRQGSVASRTDAEDRQDLRSRVLAAEDKARNAEKQAASVNDFTSSALVGIGKAMDNIAHRVKNIEARLATLPAKASTPSQADAGLRTTVDSVMAQLKWVPGRFEAMNVRVESLETAVTQLETRLEELPRQATTPQSLLHSDPEVTKFKTKVEKVEGDFEKLSTEVKGVSENFEMLNFQVTNLDSQYNNIMTKPLAEHIIAHMELVYPNNREILANMQELQRRLNIVEQEVRKAEEGSRKAIEDLSKRVTVSLGQHVAAGQPTQKRRRLDESTKGSPRPSLSGGDRSVSSPAGRERQDPT